MQREIKFRALVNGKFIYSDSYIDLRYYFDAVCDYPQFQYTGLKDKNGKEIYEGDVVQLGDLVCKIFFEDACFQIGMDERQGTNHFNKSRASKFEVIGNIYEHPYLLNKESEDERSVANEVAQRTKSTHE